MAEQDDNVALIRRWFQKLQLCIQAVDFVGSRALFADDIVTFGSFAAFTVGREATEQEQWRHVWSHIDQFRWRLEQTAAWTQTAAGSSGIKLALAAIDTGLASAARTNFDLFGQLAKQWRREAIAARCRMDHSDIAKIADLRPGWRCTDVDVTVLHLSFDELGSARARELSKVPTRFSLPADQVNAIVQAGRDVVRLPWVRRELGSSSTIRPVTMRESPATY